MNFIMDFVFQSQLADQDNGLTTTVDVMMLITNVTHLILQLELVPAVFKVITILTVSVVLLDNITLMEIALLLPMLLLLLIAMDAEPIQTVLDVLDATLDSKDFKINSDFIIVKLYDCFTFIFFNIHSSICFIIYHKKILNLLI